MAIGNKIIFVTPNTYVGTGDPPEGPTPEEAKLEVGKRYPVIHMELHEKIDEWLVVVINKFGEIWSLSNRHLRVTDAYQDNQIIFSLKEDHYE